MVHTCGEHADLVLLLAQSLPALEFAIYTRTANGRPYTLLDMSRIYSQRDFFSRPDRAQCNRFLRCQRRLYWTESRGTRGFLGVVSPLNGFASFVHTKEGPSGEDMSMTSAKPNRLTHRRCDYANDSLQRGIFPSQLQIQVGILTVGAAYTSNVGDGSSVPRVMYFL